MGRAFCLLAMSAALTSCGAARGDTSARAVADAGLAQGFVDGGARPPDRAVAPPPDRTAAAPPGVRRSARHRDRCERDEDCVQTTRDAACCHTCLPRVVTRLRLLDEETRCAAATSRPKCMEGDCSPATIQPACVQHRCAVKPPR